MRGIAAVLTMSLLAHLSTLSAQQPQSVEVGTRVRVSRCHDESTWRGTPRIVCDRTVGVLSTLSNNTIAVADGKDGLVIALDSVASLEVPGGQRRRTGRGALIGLAVGAGLGAMTGPAVGAAVSYGPCFESCTSGFQDAVTGAFVFGIPGLLVGTVIGAMSKTVGWEEVPLDRVRMSFAPQRDGRFAAGVSVRY